MLFEQKTAYSHWEVSYHLLNLIQSQSPFLKWGWRMLQQVLGSETRVLRDGRTYSIFGNTVVWFWFYKKSKRNSSTVTYPRLPVNEPSVAWHCGTGGIGLGLVNRDESGWTWQSAEIDFKTTGGVLSEFTSQSELSVVWSAASRSDSELDLRSSAIFAILKLGNKYTRHCPRHVPKYLSSWFGTSGVFMWTSRKGGFTNQWLAYRQIPSLHTSTL